METHGTAEIVMENIKGLILGAVGFASMNFVLYQAVIKLPADYKGLMWIYIAIGCANVLLGAVFSDARWVTRIFNRNNIDALRENKK